MATVYMNYVSKFSQKTLSYPRMVGATYAKFSNAWPHTAAGLTAFFVLGSADITAQFFERRYGGREGGWQSRRTLSLVAFGVYYYGGPCKWFYLRYPSFFEKMMPGKPLALKKMAASFVDCGIVTPTLLLPSFYLITLSIKGEPLSKIWKEYSENFVEVTGGTLLYWFPICSLNFYFVPQHSQVLVITIGSFIHKSWLSWVSNRYTNPNQSETPYADMFKKCDDVISAGTPSVGREIVLA